MATSSLIGIVATAALAAAGLLLWRNRTRLARLSWGPVLVGAVAGAAAVALTSMLWNTQSTATPPRPDEVFRSVPLPREQPPGLTEVRVQNSPTNGLEMYLNHGTVSILVCYATPDQLQVGSCTSPRTQLIRELKSSDGDIRVQRIVLLKGLKEDEAKADSTVAADTVVNYWRKAALINDPAWLDTWLD